MDEREYPEAMKCLRTDLEECLAGQSNKVRLPIENNLKLRQHDTVWWLRACIEESRIQ
jgi:hypothetical protein